MLQSQLENFYKRNKLMTILAFLKKVLPLNNFLETRRIK